MSGKTPRAEPGAQIKRRQESLPDDGILIDAPEPDLMHFFDFAGLEAASAESDLLHAAVDTGAHGLQVGQETPLGDIMSMRHIGTDHRFLAADFTYFSHAENLRNQKQTLNILLLRAEASGLCLYFRSVTFLLDLL